MASCCLIKRSQDFAERIRSLAGEYEILTDADAEVVMRKAKIHFCMPGIITHPGHGIKKV